MVHIVPNGSPVLPAANTELLEHSASEQSYAANKTPSQRHPNLVESAGKVAYNTPALARHYSMRLLPLLLLLLLQCLLPSAGIP